MNIKQAKKYMKDCVSIYLKKDDFGEYRIPVVYQRPVFLLGAPGIGKTAIMEQIAEELGIALVSYSMTHHTRQSALGLPCIKQKTYDGEVYDISEYTMSEIIAAVYETMEESGVKEGILFLDEINCVSETLAPAMLQFLQYKVFGRHRIPEGWIVVTAGNPPEFNKSVREFDVATLDRLKVMEVEADYKTWREYAIGQGIHNAILNYLDLKKEHFYRIEASIKGKTCVTARGWEDLSEILKLYEEEKLPVEEGLVIQYVRNEKIAKGFTAYYELYQKYKKDYKIEEILEGKATEKAVERGKSAPFDERLSLLGMLLDKVFDEMTEVVETADCLKELMVCLRVVKSNQKQPVCELLEGQRERIEQQMKKQEKANTMSRAEKKKKQRILYALTELQKKVRKKNNISFEEIQGMLKNDFDEKVNRMKERTVSTDRHLHYIFDFVERAFTEGNEMLILVTELTVNDFGARYISMFGCEEYKKHTEALMITERRNRLQEEITALEL